jgi:tetratricopeptide (TPR) repeat protein
MRQASSSALAQASGLEGASPFGSRVRLLLIGLALLIIGVASGVYYRQSLRALRVYSPERNLVTPEEQSLDLIRLGNQSNELGQYDKAIGQFKEALALTPQHIPIYLHLAQSYQASGQVDEALRAYWTLLRQDPKNLEARLEVAEILRARGNWREAYQEYQRIININSQSLEAIAALAVIEAHDEREYVPIRVDLPKRRPVPRIKMTALAPSLPRTGGAAPLAPQRVQGTALTAPPTLLPTQDGERGDARALAESHKTLGTRYHNVREYLAAIKEFSIALRLTPGDKDLYYLLGSCYDGLDQDALAHSFYKQCDSGTYAQVSHSGAQRTLKAALAERKKQEASSSNGSDALLPSRPTGHTLK